MSFTIYNAPKYPYMRRPIQFGKAIHRELQMQSPQGNLQAQNIVHVFTERIPVKDGGLGEVAKTTTEAQAEFMPEKDVRVIVPYQKAHRDTDRRDPAHAFKDTGVVIPEKDKFGRPVNIKVLQKFEFATGFEDTADKFTDANVEKDIGNWVYALQADDYFIGKDKEDKETGLYQFTYNPNASNFDKIMMYNRAAAKLVPMLSGEFKGAPNLQKFHNELKLKNRLQTQEQTTKQNRAINDNPDSIDVVVGHDWLSGPVLNELPDWDTTKKIFMVHNKYDNINSPEAAQKAGLVTPSRLNNREESFSALRMGLEPADGVIVNDNFANTLFNTELAGNPHFVKALRTKAEQHRTFNMHHGLSREVTAADVKDQKTGKVIVPASQSLKENYTTWKAALEKSKEGKSSDEIKPIQAKLDEVAQNLAKAKRLNLPNDELPYEFKPLLIADKNGVPTVKEMGDFKAANKKALQRKWGLTEDPNAVMIGWAARLEPRQKGFFLLQKSMEDILKSGKNVQFVILGNTKDPHIESWIRRMNKDYPGQVYIPNAFANQDEVKQLNSASDFTVLPSIYEPYGLTQLEAMKMGSIPIVHGVDGLRTTVNDPEIVNNVFRQQAQVKPEAVWNEPQNGFLMAPMDIDEYARYTNQRMDVELLETTFNTIEKAKAENREIDAKYPDKSNISAETQEKFDKNKKAIGDQFTTFVKILEESAQNRKYYQKLAEERGNQSEANVLSQKAQAITELQQRIERQKYISPENLEAVKTVLKADDAINNREAAKLTEAINRAVGQTPESAMRIRLNAFQYVNTVHAWDKLVKDYYKPVFENSFLDLKARARHKAEWEETQEALKPPKSEPPKEYVQTRQNNVKRPTGFTNLTLYYWNRVLELNQQFWATLGRFFALRKD